MHLKEEDKYLFDKVKNQDCKKSFELLFDKYYSPLCNFTYLFIKDKNVCEEVVSDVFVNIWTKRHQIEIQKELKYYLYRSTKNQLIATIRKQKPTTSINNRDIEENDIVNTLSPETLLLKKELNSKINDLFDKLPKQAGLVLRLKKIDGLKYSEISDLLGISEKTVENHITNAIKRIKKILEEQPQMKKYFR
jgi:RNA polymerase sigma-70 factor (ECF subfamily)